MTTRRRSNLRPAGYAYVFLTLLISLGAFNSQNNLLFLAFGFALAMLLVSGMLSGMMLMGMRVRRETPRAMRVGERTRLVYHVRNLNRATPAFAVRVGETDAGWLVRGGPSAAVDPKPKRRPRGGVPLLDEHDGFLAHLGPKDSALVEMPCVPMKRGLFELPGVAVESAFPFGLLDKRIEYALAAQVLVRPARLTLAPGFVSRLVRARRGRSADASTPRSAPRRRAAGGGGGGEFHALSPYRPGDEWRRIAWRASARAGLEGTLLVREHVEQPPARLLVVLELGTRVSDEQDERAIALCASIIEDAARQRIDVGLSIPAAGVLLPPKNSTRHLSAMLDALAVLDLTKASRGAVESRLFGFGVGRASRPQYGMPRDGRWAGGTPAPPKTELRISTEHRDDPSPSRSHQLQQHHGATVVVNAGQVGGAGSAVRGAVVIDAGRPSTYMGRAAVAESAKNTASGGHAA